MNSKPPSNRGDGRLSLIDENSDEGTERGTMKAMGVRETKRTSIVSRASEKGLSTKDKSRTVSEKESRSKK